MNENENQNQEEIRKAVSQERVRVAALLRAHLDEYDRDHDENGLALGVSLVAGELEGDEADAPKPEEG